MKRMNRYLLLFFLLSIFIGCSVNTVPVSKIERFILYNSETKKPFVSVVVSVYDGFDRKLRSDPSQTDNTPYYFGDFKTSPQGIFTLDLAKFKDPYGDILLKTEDCYKYIKHKDGKINVYHYKPEGNSLRIIFHYYYDLQKRLLKIKNIEDNTISKPEPFVIIKVPMDK